MNGGVKEGRHASATLQAPPRSTRPKPVLRGEAAEQAEWKRAAWTWFWMLVAGKLVIMIALAIVGYYRLRPRTATSRCCSY
ncbi:MAG: hypothetical protein U0232_22295 [Thermomicrobiales bacterium]